MIRVALSAAALAAGLSGCATPARYVERQTESGVVAIPANTDAWPANHRRAALALIERHVGDGYEIVDEREVATGKATHNNQQVDGGGARQTVVNTTTTRDVTEWRIAYRKRPPGVPLSPEVADPAGVRQTQYLSGAAGLKPAGGRADCKE